MEWPRVVVIQRERPLQAFIGEPGRKYEERLRIQERNETRWAGKEGIEVKADTL